MERFNTRANLIGSNVAILDLERVGGDLLVWSEDGDYSVGFAKLFLSIVSHDGMHANISYVDKLLRVDDCEWDCSVVDARLLGAELIKGSVPYLKECSKVRAFVPYGF